MIYSWIQPLSEKPPTLYSLMEAMINFNSEVKTKIKNLPQASRSIIFDFDYPLSSQVNKEDFEILILNHFITRRIGFETFTLFQIQLNAKLNEIMPTYNKLLDTLNWNLFNDGEVVSREVTENRVVNASNDITNNSTNTSDRRNSEMPQNELDNIRDGSYITDYNYDTNLDESTSHGSSDSTDDNTTNETINRTPSDKINIYKQFIETQNKIYSMIFKDLDCLFYQLV